MRVLIFSTLFALLSISKCPSSYPSMLKSDQLEQELLISPITKISNYFISSVLTESSDSGGSADTERKAAVKTIPTLGHQPVILGGLYSAVEDEFLPGKTLLLLFLLFLYFFFLLLLLLSSTPTQSPSQD